MSPLEDDVARARRIAPVRIEACVDSVDSAIAAQDGGADRVELCDDLIEGGTTPSAGMISLCAQRLRIPVFVIIRPRGGDFLYSESEVEVMRRDIAVARMMGAAGIVLGLLRSDGTIDVERTRLLVEEARPLPVTFHRAFDVCRDPFEALDALVRLGIERVLTSGQTSRAEDGVDLIARLVRESDGRIGILAGGGIDEGNVRRIVHATRVSEVHVRSTVVQRSPMAFRNPSVDFGGRMAASDAVRVLTDAGRIRKISELVRETGPAPRPDPGAM